MFSRLRLRVYLLVAAMCMAATSVYAVTPPGTLITSQASATYFDNGGFQFSILSNTVVTPVLGAVVGEWLGGSRGLGVYMTRALQSFRTDRLFAAILIVMLLSFALFQVTDGIGRLLTPWLERRQHA